MLRARSERWVIALLSQWGDVFAALHADQKAPAPCARNSAGFPTALQPETVRAMVDRNTRPPLDAPALCFAMICIAELERDPEQRAAWFAELLGSTHIGDWPLCDVHCAFVLALTLKLPDDALRRVWVHLPYAMPLARVGRKTPFVERLLAEQTPQRMLADIDAQCRWAALHVNDAPFCGLQSETSVPPAKRLCTQICAMDE